MVGRTSPARIRKPLGVKPDRAEIARTPRRSLAPTFDFELFPMSANAGSPASTWDAQSRPRPPRFQKVRFQPEIPLRRPVSSIMINRGLCFNPSAWRIILSWPYRRNSFANIRNIAEGSKRFQAATKSMWQRSRLTGMTVARLKTTTSRS